MNGKDFAVLFSVRSLHLAPLTGLTRKLEMESREDEARMWSILCILRFPDADAFYNQGVLLNKMSLA